MEPEGSDCRLREAIAGGGEQSQVEGSYHGWREAITGGATAEERNCRWRGAIAGGGKLVHCTHSFVNAVVWNFCIDKLGLDCFRTHWQKRVYFW